MPITFLQKGIFVDFINDNVAELPFAHLGLEKIGHLPLSPLRIDPQVFLGHRGAVLVHTALEVAH